MVFKCEGGIGMEYMAAALFVIAIVSVSIAYDIYKIRKCMERNNND